MNSTGYAYGSTLLVFISACRPTFCIYCVESLLVVNGECQKWKRRVV